VTFLSIVRRGLHGIRLEEPASVSRDEPAPLPATRIANGWLAGADNAAWGMSILIRAALVAVLLAPAPTLAQPATAARCRDLIASAPLLQDGAATAEAAGGGGCRFTNVTFGFLSRFGYQVASLVERGIPFGPLTAPNGPVSIRIEARGIVLVLHGGQPKLDWLNRQQQVPFDVVLDGSYDPAKGLAVLNELSLEGRAVGRAMLGGEVGDVNAADVPGRAGLRTLELHLDSRRFIVAFLLASLLPFLPDDDPGGAVERIKAQVIAALHVQLPTGGASAATVNAVASFIADFPHPQHVFDLTVTATPLVTVGALEQAVSDLAAAARLMRTLTVTASYAGDPR